MKTNKTLPYLAAGTQHYTSASGDVVTFHGDGSPLKGLVVSIRPVQEGSGDPSPDNVRPISGWTGANIWRTGKNLLKINGTSGVNNGVTYTMNSDGSVSVSGNDGGNYSQKYLIDDLLLPTGTYILSCNGLPNNKQRLYVFPLDSTSTAYAAINDNTYSSIFTFTEDTHVRVRLNSARYNAEVDYICYPMIRVSSVPDATWQSYIGTTIPISWQSEAGTVYGGTLDVTTGVLTVDMAMVDFGSLVWTMTEITGYGYSTFNSNVSNNKAQNRNQICSAYKVVNENRFHLSNGDIGSYNDSSALRTISIRDDAFTDIETFKSARSGVQLVYELVTPLTYQLTPTQIMTLLGQNNVWADCGPVSVEYHDEQPGKTAMLLARRRPELLWPWIKGDRG